MKFFHEYGILGLLPVLAALLFSACAGDEFEATDPETGRKEVFRYEYFFSWYAQDGDVYYKWKGERVEDFSSIVEKLQSVPVGSTVYFFPRKLGLYNGGITVNTNIYPFPISPQILENRFEDRNIKFKAMPFDQNGKWVGE